jgi:hypothetical membrane protein
MDQSSRMPSRLGLLLGGASWILTLLYFIGQLVAQAAWKTPYSLLDNRVSDLGNTECGRTLANAYICSPLHAVMNATFVVTGVLILLGLFVTRSIWPRRRLTTWGLILLGVAGVGTVLIGLSPENVNVLFHVIGALNIPTGNAAMILLGLAIWHEHLGRRIAPRRAEEERGYTLFVAERRRGRRAPKRDPRGASAASGAIELAWFSVLSGVIGFLGLLVGPFLVILTGHGGGLAERIALYPLIIWLIVFGLSFVKRRHTSVSDQAPAVDPAVSYVSADQIPVSRPQMETRDKSAGQALVSHPETGNAGWVGTVITICSPGPRVHRSSRGDLPGQRGRHVVVAHK